MVRVRVSELHEAMIEVNGYYEALRRKCVRRTIYVVEYKSWYYGWREYYNEDVRCIDDEVVDLLLEEAKYALKSDDAETIIRTARLLRSKRLISLIFNTARPAESVEIVKHSGGTTEYKKYYYCPTGVFIICAHSSGTKPGNNPGHSWDEWCEIREGDLEGSGLAEVVAKEKNVPKEVIEYLLKLGIDLKTIARAEIKIAEEATVKSWACSTSLYGDVEKISEETEDAQCGPNPDVVYKYRIKDGAILARYSCDMDRDSSSSLVIYVFSPELAQLAHSSSRS